MTSVVEQARRLRPEISHLAAKGRDRPDHAGLVGIQHLDDLEPGGLEALRDQHGIVDRVLQRHDALIGAVSDHQRKAFLGARGPDSKQQDRQTRDGLVDLVHFETAPSGPCIQDEGAVLGKGPRFRHYGNVSLWEN